MGQSESAQGVPGWPAVQSVERSWSTNPDQRGTNGARPNVADRLLTTIRVEIPQPISGLRVELPSETVALCEEAARAISGMQNDSGMLAGISGLMARTEAIASSRVERVYADIDDLARASVGERSTLAARQTMAAIDALRTLTDSCNESRDLAGENILAAHLALLGKDLLEGAHAGKWRSQQNWIGGSDFSPRNALHVPPPAHLVPELMQDLVGFANRNDMSGVAQAAIAHGQLEAIHPFTDGNGRIGRGLIGAVFRRRGLTATTTVPVAAAMLADVDGYFRQLAAYRSGDVNELVVSLAGACLAAAEATHITATELALMPQKWHERAPARRGSSARRLIDQLIAHPVFEISRAQAITGTTRMRAYGAIDALVDARILAEITGGGRNRIWLAVDVMEELANLEERIGLRTKPAARFR